MKKNFPTGMLVLAVAVGVGMVGSQLGGLSGQAAGGDSAGCGGDAYYDEELGELVESDGNAAENVASAVEADSATGTQILDMRYEAHASGEAMEGQSRVRIIRPIGEALSELAAITDGEVTFRPHVSVTQNGEYALVAFDAPGYVELNQVHLLKYDGAQWDTIMGWVADRKGLKINMPSIGSVLPRDEGNVVVFSLGQDYLFAFDEKAQTVEVIEPTNFRVMEAYAAEMNLDELDELGLRSELLQQMPDLAITDFVQTRVQHPWLEDLMQAQYGDDVEYTLSTSMNNRIFVAVDTGDILSIDGCEVGNSPFMAGGELVCATCEAVGGCDNIFNKVEMLNVNWQERAELAANVQAQLIDSNKLRPIAINPNTAFKDSSYADSAARAVYESCIEAGSGLGDVCYSMSKSGDNCTVAVRGSKTIKNWLANAHSLFDDAQSAWGESADVVKGKIDAEGCSSVTVTGHSRGGAIAAHLAVKYGYLAHTFAAPRSTDNEDDRHDGSRYWYEDDVVTGIGSNFHSANTVVKLEEKCSGPFWDRSCKIKRDWTRSHNNDGASRGIFGWIGAILNASGTYKAHVCAYTDGVDGCRGYVDGYDY